MKRIVKYNDIGESSYKILQKLNELEQEKQTLITHIGKINDYYKGSDADDIVAKYNEKIKYIDSYITVIENYQRYFEWLGGRYKESHQKAFKNMKDLYETADKKTETLNTNVIDEIEPIEEVAESLLVEGELW